MPFDEIDDALRRQPAWDPPAGFSRRVAEIAVVVPAQSAARSHPAAMTTLWLAVAGFASSCSATLGGYAWILRQYWALLAR
jgi:hypothetical protein